MAKGLTGFFRKLPIRYKLILGYSSVFVFTLLLGSLVLYSLMRSTIEANTESELTNSTATILGMVRTAANGSIRNYLRAVAETNRQLVEKIYLDYKKGLLGEKQAKAKARAVLLSQTIGQTGYIYVIDSTGLAVVHPKEEVENHNFRSVSFIIQQVARKQGYLEYEWGNPGEPHPRPKAMYMSYFAPWDWIISVTSYRDEFRQLVKVSDFRDAILALKFGKTGYCFVLDGNGNLMVHPKLTGNWLNVADPQGNQFVRRILDQKNGKITYFWKNPGEDQFREKLVIFNHIPEFDWIVASSCYLEEVYAPLQALGETTVATMAITLTLVIILTFLISASITRPLKTLRDRFSAGASGDFSVRMWTTLEDEVGQLAGYFNRFMDKLEGYSVKLLAEMRDRRRSEEMFSTAFRSSPLGVMIASLDQGRFINVNDSFQRFTGYPHPRVVGQTFASLGFFKHQAQAEAFKRTLLRQGWVRNQEIEFARADGEARLGVISADIVELWGQDCLLASLQDVTDARRMEREILEISEREQQKIGQDLHDDLCPHLLGVEVLSKVLERDLERNHLPQAQDAAKIGSLVRDSISKLRRLSRGLCPLDLGETGLDSTLSELCVYMEDIFGTSCCLECDYPVTIPDRTSAANIYYIAHEAMHNAIKHAGAKSIRVRLKAENGDLVLIIEDDGCGLPDHIDKTGMGLSIMRYRAQRIGATLRTDARLQGGTVVTLEVANQAQAQH